MALGRIVGVFLALWFLFYLVAYVVFITPDAEGEQAKIDPAAARSLNVEDSPFAKQRKVDTENAGELPTVAQGEDVHRKFVVVDDHGSSFPRPAVLSDPFVSAGCAYSIQKVATSGQIAYSVGIVIPARNERKAELLRTVRVRIRMEDELSTSWHIALMKLYQPALVSILLSYVIFMGVQTGSFCRSIL
jgi:hypothetical protein